MPDLKLLNLSDLLDSLIDQTSYHMQLIAVGATPEEFKISGEILTELQTEITSRKGVTFESKIMAPSAGTRSPGKSKLDSN